jgi:hypothetical protein
LSAESCASQRKGEGAQRITTGEWGRERLGLHSASVCAGARFAKQNNVEGLSRGLFVFAPPKKRGPVSRSALMIIL